MKISLRILAFEEGTLNNLASIEAAVDSKDLLGNREVFNERVMGPALDAIAARLPSDGGMPRYVCHKEVCALKIVGVMPGRADGEGPGITLLFEDSDLRMSLDERWDSKHSPKEGGYLVQYKDGYLSFSPAAAFEEGYTKL